MNRFTNNKNDTQELKLSILPLDFRLDILRLTFKIEEKIEKGILSILNFRKISVEDFKKKCSNDNDFKKFREWFKGKAQESDVWNKKKDGSETFNLQNFINNSTFGGLLKLISIIKYDIIKEEYTKIVGKLEFKVFRKWCDFIISIRNILAHRSNINVNTFFEKLQMPAQSKNLNTKKLTLLELKYFIFNFFLKEEQENEKIKEIFLKYDLKLIYNNNM